MDVDAGLTELLSDLDEAIALLRAAGESYWRAWLEQDRDRIANGDAYGLDSLLQAFGGMGSFNDLVLSQPNAEASQREFLREADERLWDLRQGIWQACQQLGGRSR